LVDQGGGNCCQSAHGFYVMGDHNLFDGVTIFNVGQHGGQFFHYGGSSSAHDNVVQNSIIHDNGTAGIGSECVDLNGDRNTVRNTLCYNNQSGFGLGASGRVGGQWIYNNTIVGTTSYATYSGSGGGHVIQNNIAIPMSGRYFAADAPTTFSSNLCNAPGEN